MVFVREDCEDGDVFAGVDERVPLAGRNDGDLSELPGAAVVQFVDGFVRAVEGVCCRVKAEVLMSDDSGVFCGEDCEGFLFVDGVVEDGAPDFFYAAGVEGGGGVAGEFFCEDGFAGGTPGGAAGFGGGDLADGDGAQLEGVEDLLVDGVDLPAEFVEL